MAMVEDFEPEFETIDEEVISARLKTLQIPVSDEFFADSKKLPFAVYLTPSAEYSGADGYNMQREQLFRIELYTLSKKDPLRKKLFKLFRDIPFSVEEVSGGLKNYYLTAIEFSSTLFDLDDDIDETNTDDDLEDD